MATGRHLGFDPPRNSAIRSAVSYNPTLQPKHDGDRVMRCRVMAI